MDDLEKKIRAAQAEGRRYTPTDQEWELAPSYQRRQMTWPRDVLEWIRRTA